MSILFHIPTLIAAASALLGFLIAISGMTLSVDEMIYDHLSTRIVSPPDAPGAILVAIDEPSMSDIGPWPWSRAVHGALVESLRDAGANSIAFDILFSDPKDFNEDAVLIAAMGIDVVLARDTEEIETPQGRITQQVLPLPELLALGARIGSAALPIDFDGAMRRMPPDGALSVEIAGRDAAPKDARIAYAGPPDTYPRVSFYQALTAKTSLPPGFFKDADIIVGFALRAAVDINDSVADHFRTPWTARGEGMMSGVEVHANALDTLRLERWIMPMNRVLVAFFAAFAGLSAAVLTGNRNAWLAALLTGIVVSTPLAASAAAFGQALWIPPVSPVLAAMIGGLARIIHDYAREHARRRAVTSAFGHYLAPELVDRLANNPQSLTLGGEKREITVLFCDIRGFTEISESMKDDPERLTLLVNRALTPIANTILAHDGTIDKFIGDCVMGIWNAPLDIPNHHHKAVEAGCEIIPAIEALNAQFIAERQKSGLSALEIKCGIGINSGVCVVGNMGTAKRFDYTAMGDAVNLAARLEARTKYYGLDLIVGHETAAVAHPGLLIEIDRVAVKGKEELTPIFTARSLLLGSSGTDLHHLQNEALAAYRSQDWAKAKKAWTTIAKRAISSDAYCNMMLARIADLENSPPSEDWDGGWRFEEK